MAGRKPEYSEVKTSKTYGLTPTGAKLFDELAKELGLSPSVLIEKLARREIPIGEYQMGKSLTN